MKNHKNYNFNVFYILTASAGHLVEQISKSIANKITLHTCFFLENSAAHDILL